MAERKHCHLLETSCVMVIAASLPPHFWMEVISTSTYLINIQPSTALHGGIPFERLCDCSLGYLVLHLFGCVSMFFLPPVSIPN
jgi:hypothetical protein